MKVKIDGKLYDAPEEDDTGLTLGEQSLVKREYGFVPGKEDFDLRDPDHVRAFLFIVLRKELPKVPATALTSQIDNVREIGFVNDDGSEITDEQAQAEAEIEKDPTPLPSESVSVSENEPSEDGS